MRSRRFSIALLSHDQYQAYSQKRPARRARDREDGGSRDGTGGGEMDSAAARPRGMSDASFMHKTPKDSYANGTMLKNGGGNSSDSTF